MKNVNKRILWGGYLLIFSGVLTVLVNLGMLDISLETLKYWPAVFIFIGIEQIIKYFFQK